ncbi:hypothetical protein BD779DRAFT_1197069 [Infundibulicybe gibba]|nr:hypothetical protein BD779DRAFT_1197069 [Infundibulicybe gibba]
MVPSGSRFDASTDQGKKYRDRHSESSIQNITQSHGLSVSEVAFRWLSHHSRLNRKFGDSVIIGVSTLDHMRQVGFCPTMLPSQPSLYVSQLEFGRLRKGAIARSGRAGIA